MSVLRLVVFGGSAHDISNSWGNKSSFQWAAELAVGMDWDLTLESQS